MWVPATVFVIALLLQWRPLRDVLKSESIAAFGISLVAVFALFRFDLLG